MRRNSMLSSCNCRVARSELHVGGRLGGRIAGLPGASVAGCVDGSAGTASGGAVGALRTVERSGAMAEPRHATAGVTERSTASASHD